MNKRQQQKCRGSHLTIRTRQPAKYVGHMTLHDIDPEHVEAVIECGKKIRDAADFLGISLRDASKFALKSLREYKP